MQKKSKNMENNKDKNNKDKKGKIKTGSVLKNVYGYFLKSAWKEHKMYFLFRFLRLLMTAAEPFVALIFLPKIIEELMGNCDVNKLIQYASTIVIANFLLWVLMALFGSVVDYYAMAFDNHYKMVLSRRIMELDFMKTEDKEALDQLSLAKNGLSWYSGGLNGLVEPLFNIISAFIVLTGVVVIILLKAPFVLLIVFVVLIFTTIINGKLNHIEEEGYAKLSKINRIFEYLAWNLADFRYGEDIRLYSAKDMLINKWKDYTRNSADRMKNIADKQLPLRLLSMVSDVCRDIGSYLYLGYLALFEKITIPNLTQMIASAGTFSFSITEIIISYQDMVKRANYANEFVKFLDYPLAMHSGTKNIEDRAHEFVFSHVSFAYPGTTKEVLSDMNLTISTGQHLSIVGLNGAGKTTMIKLLCRLYDPTSGEILMDGVNIKEYNYEQYMSVFAPVFQDFKLFSFPVSENLLLHEGRDEEEERMLQDTLQKVGVYEKIQSFPHGLDTILFKYFDDEGINPSGGEQQKLAIARALIKNAPVVVLDEPTAALDPIAEYEVYSQFQDLVQGKTAIFISHRLSSCQFCDKIAVFSDGHVAEYGTHAELYKKPNGIYAEMFEAQAQYYRNEDKLA